MHWWNWKHLVYYRFWWQYFVWSLKLFWLIIKFWFKSKSNSRRWPIVIWSAYPAVHRNSRRKNYEWEKPKLNSKPTWKWIWKQYKSSSKKRKENQITDERIFPRNRRFIMFYGENKIEEKKFVIFELWVENKHSAWYCH